MSEIIEIDLSQAVPTLEWNYYGSGFSRETPKEVCLQIEWHGLSGTLNGTIGLEISNQRGDDLDSNDFVTNVPLLDSEGNPITLNSASNKTDCYMQVIKLPHGSWRLKLNKGGITAGTLKTLMVVPSR